MRKYLWIASGLSLSGVLFAGYLSSVKALSGVCAFNEPCPLFLGYPACYTGFALFSALLATSVIALGRKVERTWPAIVNTAISTAGVLFAGRLTLLEISGPAELFGYGMGLPTCAYGFVFFAALMVASAIAWARQSPRSLHGSPVLH